ncbi:helix-turn-helix domain-containing protein [Demetria terragena]|uniref:helix-turn-helix domain-containing protein n=1 Tax=Demetria terragena TaxID=63959 RepID=UPI000377F044|nr:helix-turn-helix domain-containing protein [Demetria terragena]
MWSSGGTNSARAATAAPQITPDCVDPTVVIGTGDKISHRTSVLSNGDLSFDDHQEPCSTNPGDVGIWTRSLPREPLEDRVGPVMDLEGVVLPRHLIGTQVAVCYLTGLDQPAEGTLETDLVRIAIDLLVQALNEAMVQVSLPIPPKTAALLRIEQAIDRHLRDGDTTAGLIAADAGLSVRRANTILAERDTSLIRELTKRRIDRVAHDFSQPINEVRSISDIAQSWGFRHMGRFSSTFKAQYGKTPLQHRTTICHRQETR